MDLRTPDYTQQLIAQSLQSQGPQNAGTALARLATIYLANKTAQKREEEQKASRQADIARILQATTGQPYSTSGEVQAGPPGPTNQRDIAAALLQSQDPKFQQIGIQQMFGGDNLGTYNPRDYTTESWAQFSKSRDPSTLKRYEPFRNVMVQGVPFTQNAVTGELMPGNVGGGQITPQKVGEIAGAVEGGKVKGREQAKISMQAKTEADDGQVLEDQLIRIFNDPNFESSVGPVNAITGRIGEAMGTEAGVLGGEVQRVANKLVQGIVANWKGAISDSERKFFLESVPGRGSSPETWRHWYKYEFLPMKALKEQRAAEFSEVNESQTTNETQNIDDLINKYAD